ncbi:hypothetical protein [Nitrincola sp.]|uniref:hypothetical protein n=1 Tax=Nitrincola sp. TaxID=1926584 RepID=UPI003A936D35
MKLPIYSSLLIISLLLSGCVATTPQPTAASPMNAETSRQVVTIDQFARDPERLYLHVPSASNAISNRMVLVSLRSGTRSQAVNTLVNYLNRQPASSIGVVGDHEEINLATIDVALQQLNPDTERGKLYVVSKAIHGDLVDQASAVGVELILIQP